MWCLAGAESCTSGQVKRFDFVQAGLSDHIFLPHVCCWPAQVTLDLQQRCWTLQLPLEQVAAACGGTAGSSSSRGATGVQYMLRFPFR